MPCDRQIIIIKNLISIYIYLPISRKVSTGFGSKYKYDAYLFQCYKVLFCLFEAPPPQVFVWEVWWFSERFVFYWVNIRYYYTVCSQKYRRPICKRYEYVKGNIQREMMWVQKVDNVGHCSRTAEIFKYLLFSFLWHISFSAHCSKIL